MKTSFDTIFPEIRDKLIIKSKLGFTSYDFIENMLTLLTTVKYQRLKYALTFRASDNFFEDADDLVMKVITDKLEKQCAKPIWRI